MSHPEDSPRIAELLDQVGADVPIELTEQEASLLRYIAGHKATTKYEAVVHLDNSAESANKALWRLNDENLVEWQYEYALGGDLYSATEAGQAWLKDRNILPLYEAPVFPTVEEMKAYIESRGKSSELREWSDSSEPNCLFWYLSDDPKANDGEYGRNCDLSLTPYEALMTRCQELSKQD